MLDEYDIFKDYLQQHNLRWTPQRKLILNVFLPGIKGNPLNPPCQGEDLFIPPPFIGRGSRKVGLIFNYYLCSYSPSDNF